MPVRTIENPIITATVQGSMRAEGPGEAPSEREFGEERREGCDDDENASKLIARKISTIHRPEDIYAIHKKQDARAQRRNHNYLKEEDVKFFSIMILNGIRNTIARLKLLPLF